MSDDDAETPRPARGRPRRGRRPTEDELAVWRQVARTVRRRAALHAPPEQPQSPPPPATPPSAVPPPPSKPSPPRASRSLRPSGPPEPPTRVDLAPSPGPTRLARATPGLDGGTARRMMRGERDPDARLDLHGMTADRAHHALLAFVLREQAAGARMVLVITGKGGGARGEAAREANRPRWIGPESGVLRTLAPHWLAQPPLAALVVGVYAAHRRHGGDGALYVYLRKPGGGRPRYSDDGYNM